MGVKHGIVQYVQKKNGLSAGDAEILSILQSGNVLMTAQRIVKQPKDFQEGRAIEIMYKFDGKDPYFVYYLNEDYYFAAATNSRFNANPQEYRNKVSLELGRLLVGFIYEQTGENIGSLSVAYSHNRIHTHTLAYVSSKSAWYPIRDPGENGVDSIVARINAGNADISEYISINDSSP